MAKYLKDQKLSNKERFDQRTMRYFMPRSKYRTRITHNDTIKMANLSSRGQHPKRRTKGFLNLLWGKTYRDLQITQWKDDIRAGYFTKSEIYSGVPEWLQPWVESKLKDVPYDVDGTTSRMLVRMYHHG